MRINEAASGLIPGFSIMDSMVKFAKSAADGGFEVSETGGNHLIDAIDRFDQ